MTSTGGLSMARLSRMHRVMAGNVERGEVPGTVTLVSRRGEDHVDAIGIKDVSGSDPMRRVTIFRIASMTKPITAGAAMILVEECRTPYGFPRPSPCVSRLLDLGLSGDRRLTNGFRPNPRGAPSRCHRDP